MTPNLYMANTFLAAYSALPSAQQKKVREFLVKFQNNPTAPSLHYEPIYDVRDNRVRTARIDQTYRAVLLQPDQGAAYVLLWVDHHDRAMAWAGAKVFPTNPLTGAVQVLDMQAVETLNSQAPAAMPEKPLHAYALFELFADPDLLRLGVPAVLLPAVRALYDTAALEAMQPHLPEEAYECLLALAAGYSVEEALAFAGAGPAGAAPAADLSAALAHPDSRRRFHLLESPADIDRVLDAPMATWRVFLHPSQERLVTRHFQGPARVLGGAGTGKTVVAMHRARHLARTVCRAPEDRVLFTTFTRNLALNIEQNLQNLCGPEFERIEVLNLHAWVSRFLAQHGQPLAIAPDDEKQQCWRNAVEETAAQAWPEAFLRREWDVVVQGQGITDRAGYLQASRQGQSRALNRSQRDQLWTVFAAYRRQLERSGRQEWQDAVRAARLLLESGKAPPPYRSVVVDETQDLTPEELRLLRRMAPEGPDDLFFVGDAHQRIYGFPVVMQQCGIHIRGRAARLRINYRTTDEIRRWATALLTGAAFDDLDGGEDDLHGYQSLMRGFAPVVKCFADPDAECAFLVQEIRTLSETAPPESICLVARTHDHLRRLYLPALRAAGIGYLFLERDTPDYVGSGVRLATMHRVKGLEFAHVLLAGVNAGNVPSGRDESGAADALQAERCLLHVAATRARETLTVTSAGVPSPLLSGPGLRSSDGH